MFLECLGKLQSESDGEIWPLPQFIETHTITSIGIYSCGDSFCAIAEAFDGEQVQSYILESDFVDEKSARDYIRDIICEFDGCEPISDEKKSDFGLY